VEVPENPSPFDGYLRNSLAFSPNILKSFGAVTGPVMGMR
jgi:hypothetical protein